MFMHKNQHKQTNKQTNNMEEKKELMNRICAHDIMVIKWDKEKKIHYMGDKCNECPQDALEAYLQQLIAEDTGKKTSGADNKLKVISGQKDGSLVCDHGVTILRRKNDKYVTGDICTQCDPEFVKIMADDDEPKKNVLESDKEMFKFYEGYLEYHKHDETMRRVNIHEFREAAQKLPKYMDVDVVTELGSIEREFMGWILEGHTPEMARIRVYGPQKKTNDDESGPKTDGNDIGQQPPKKRAKVPQ